jgi:homoserine kinase type II
LVSIHPALTTMDDLATDLVRELPDAGRWFADRAPEIEEETRQYESTLPVQIIHGDFALSNLLVEGGRVTGVLDFEVAGLDLRAAELAAALLMTTDTPLEVAAFRSGYGSLSPAEEEALPALILRRALGSVVWRAGHWKTGHSTLEMVRERLALVRELDRRTGSTF